MSDYFIISESLQTSETGGIFPQLEMLKYPLDFDDEKSIYNIRQLDTDKEYQFVVPDFKLANSSKLTDFLSFSGDFFVVSLKAYEILTQNSVPSHKIITCKVFYKEQDYIYNILYFFSNTYDYTDYCKSRFTFRFREKEAILNQILGSRANMEQEASLASYRSTNLMYKNSQIDIAFDFFKVNYLQREYFISKKLMNQFIENGVTGIDYYDNYTTVFSGEEEKLIVKKYKAFERDRIFRTEYYSNGQCFRRVNMNTENIDEFGRNGKRTSELIIENGKFKGSEREFFANGMMRLEKLVFNKRDVCFKYFFKNGNLNFQIIYSEKDGVKCDEVFDIDGNLLKEYGLKRGTGKTILFNSNGKGGEIFYYENNELQGTEKVTAK